MRETVFPEDRRMKLMIVGIFFHLVEGFSAEIFGGWVALLNVFDGRGCTCLTIVHQLSRVVVGQGGGREGLHIFVIGDADGLVFGEGVREMGQIFFHILIRLKIERCPD